MTAKCTEKGCDFVAHHPTQNYANVLLGKHKAKVHGIRSPHQLKYGRKYNKTSESLVRKSALETPQVVERQTPNFCPNCGCNLAAVTAALNLRRRS